MSDTLFYIWAAANVLTGLAYLGIPIEIRHWYRSTGDGTIGFLALPAFLVFVSCGIHHLVMPFTHGMVHWANLATDIPMAVVSVAAHVLLNRNRTGIVRWFQKG